MHTYSATDTVTWVFHNHTFKFGVDAQTDAYLQVNHNRAGTFTTSVNASNPNNATKIKSLTDGTSHRTHAGSDSAAEPLAARTACAEVSADDLMEPIAIALNLIE